MIVQVNDNVFVFFYGFGEFNGVLDIVGRFKGGNDIFQLIYQMEINKGLGISVSNEFGMVGIFLVG